MSSADTSTETEAPEEEAPLVDEPREALLGQITAALGDAVVGSHIRPLDDLWVRVDRDAWPQAAAELKALGYDFFDYLSAIDWLPSPYGRDMDAQEDLAVHGGEPKDPGPLQQGYAGGDTRFQVIGRLYSIAAGMGVHLKADIADDDLRIGSWTPHFRGANWHERECFEMFGITFDGHPNLIKLYLPADFQGHPLRKDFPLLSRRVRPWPGIVDVEPLPGEGDDEGEGE
ncbi:NADH-quinone oxidoreductase subunit C [Rhabdothermincola salaria]|uniref:NADH-quinone oxidoreductase subunit C n=1 Tax=Rhabdothermincola salaria TaxID=2903142 RepID=UPI001E34BEB8|nr:NADH-quinone oxidoreductase subunit C [Rhabdothermincola salaria]MCD9625732.1 NADH-quinone oxidoreductase subunit C [Rhabdothermincola salaria]